MTALRFAAAAALMACVSPTLAALVASDDFDGSSAGLGAAVFVGTGGGSFIAPSIDSDSFGLFSGGGFSSYVREISDSATFLTANNVTLTLSTRFNVPNNTGAGFKGFNLKNTSSGGFGDGELISVGMLDGMNTSLAVTDAAGGPVYKLDFGGAELRGAVIDFTLSLDSATGDYTLDAATRGGAVATTVLGSLTNPGDFIPRAIGFAHGGAGGSGNDVFFDNLAISAVPEVSPALVMPLLAGLGVAFRGRRR